MDPILQTKLYIPRSTSAQVIIPRLHLLQKLEATLHRKFALVAAPTGFGKTTLVATWLAQLTAVHPLWLSLDQNDNDLARFLTYFIHALRGAAASIGEAALLRLHSSAEPSFTTLLTAVLNEIAQLDTPIVLVLDDYHLITEPQIHACVQFFLQNQPPTLHLVIISRSDPPWPLARWRARGDMLVLHDDELRFTLEETAVFLKEVMGLALSLPQIKALDERFEGWIAGLQMAALAWQGRNDIASLMQTITADHRFILDYLVEEVLQQQSATVQAFLVQSSVLDRLNGPLCDAVLDRDDSQTILAQLERSHLFLIPLDEARRWYRYHHLFGELLYGRLRQTEPESIRPLQTKASQWYEAQGLVDEAVSYALAAEDFERVAGLIAQNALAMAYHGNLKTLLNWIEALPHEMVQERPWLPIAHAWALAFSGQLETAENRLQIAEKLLIKEDAANQPQLTGTIALVRAYCTGIRVEPTRTIELAGIALHHLPPDDWLARGMATLLSAIGLRMAGDLRGAASLFAEAVASSQAAKDYHFQTDVLWERAVLEFHQGQLHQVMASCQQALALAHEYSRQSGRQLPVQGYIYERMGAVLLEWNDLTAALHYAQEGVALSQKWGQADAIVTNSLGLAAVQLALGQAQQALVLVEQAQEMATGLSEWYVLTAVALKAQIWLACGEVKSAVAWLEESGLRYDDTPDAAYRHLYLPVAKILLAQGKLAEADTLLHHLLTAAKTAGATHTVIRVLVLQALVFHAQRKSDLAVKTLAQALALAEPQGYVRTFVDAGEGIKQLLQQTAVANHSVTYVNNLLEAMATEPQTAHSPTPSNAAIEPLSPRELDVLRLLATPLSGVEIAAELVIAPSTVRSHIKNIYRKLDVHKRVTAVQRAQALGLL